MRSASMIEWRAVLVCERLASMKGLYVYRRSKFVFCAFRKCLIMFSNSPSQWSCFIALLLSLTSFYIPHLALNEKSLQQRTSSYNICKPNLSCYSKQFNIVIKSLGHSGILALKTDHSCLFEMDDNFKYDNKYVCL